MATEKKYVNDLVIKKNKAPYDTWTSKDGKYQGERFSISREKLVEYLAMNSEVEYINLRTIEEV